MAARRSPGKRSHGRTPGDAATGDLAPVPWSAEGWSPPPAGVVAFSVAVRTAAELSLGDPGIAVPGPAASAA